MALAKFTEQAHAAADALQRIAAVRTPAAAPTGTQLARDLRDGKLQEFLDELRPRVQR